MPGYLEFEVTLGEIEPRIWRRFQIADEATFGDLHRAIRDSFGWYGGHLWEFQNTRQRPFAGFANDFMAEFGDDFMEGLDEPTPDAEEVRLASYFPASRSCVYLYDFGDSWTHSVKLRQRASSPDRFHRRLLGGRRACPPEDCGGVPGYYRFVSVVETGVDPWDEDVADLKDWVGGWDPCAFDLKSKKRAFDTAKPIRDPFP